MGNKKNKKSVLNGNTNFLTKAGKKERKKERKNE